MHTTQAQYEPNLAAVLALKSQLKLTDALIDEVMYRLHGLTDEEIRVVEGKE